MLVRILYIWLSIVLPNLQRKWLIIIHCYIFSYWIWTALHGCNIMYVLVSTDLLQKCRKLLICLLFCLVWLILNEITYYTFINYYYYIAKFISSFTISRKLIKIINFHLSVSELNMFMQVHKYNIITLDMFTMFDNKELNS